ncbi:MAG: 1-deoxy-D-xylulose-5-phosphate synthase [Desulfonauticus sp.]|nr:1-deoxy-D-xylulose-5-phosphate synthase [Desulfonauticus sp.]
MGLLEEIKLPEDLKRLSYEELVTLAQEVRELIITVVSKNGGHLAPSLGVVELTLALLKVFDPAQDKLVWDVGHQSYPYKILTDRKDRFATLRKLGGISGFIKPEESPFDCFGVGHSSTSISAALGMIVARDLAKQTHKVVAIIGDGSMTAGLAYEGLNQAGDLGKDLIVILNDNEMSISKNVGALSSFLSRQLSSQWMIKIKKEIENFLRQIPKIGEDLIVYAKKGEGSFKNFFTPGILFEAFKFNYIGPVDGHDIEGLVDVLSEVKKLDVPVLVHVLTKKGKGYAPAEKNPVYFHGVSGFKPENCQIKKITSENTLSYTEVFGATLCKLAKNDPKIVAITAAMPEGTGLHKFAKQFSERFFDVGICEQHAVTFAAGLAKEGFKPVVAIYSTFLQRAYDQIVHDVCLQNLPVVFCLDRAGLVGEDGPTHHGVFDLSYLSHIPNMIVSAPKDEAELQLLLYTALKQNQPFSIRYPRGKGVGVDLYTEFSTIPIGSGELLRTGQDILLIAVGSMVYPALQAIQDIGDYDIGLYNLRFIKPVREEFFELIQQYKILIIAEENVLIGGAGSVILDHLRNLNLLDKFRIYRIGLPDKFIEHGSQAELRQKYLLDKEGLKEQILKFLK